MPRSLPVGSPVICICGCKFCTICPPGNTIGPHSVDTFIDGVPVVFVGSKSSNCCGCCCPCLNTIATGSVTTFVEGKLVALDTSVITCGIPISTAKTVVS